MFAPVDKIADLHFTLLVRQGRYKVFRRIMIFDAPVGVTVAGLISATAEVSRLLEKVVSTLITQAFMV